MYSVIEENCVLMLLPIISLVGVVAGIASGLDSVSSDAEIVDDKQSVAC
jgi:uncharacterized membrane protein